MSRSFSIPNLPSSVFTVSQLNQSVRQLLETEMGHIWLSGEISNFSQPSSGHWYFTLKDEKAQVRCAMFKMANQRVTFKPQNGQQVLVKAGITLYEPRGDYQLIAENMHPAGDGALQQQFEQLKQKLNAEGLFDSIHKKPLPKPAKCIGVVTSASGAALHDIIQILRRRDPSLPVIIYPTAVQGADAIPQIIKAIEIANRRAECDILIVGRGGGSLEDLWCFNDERVARAIFTSKIPIVSAVGHETDVTIADFVADLRAPTPSAAAELVSRNQVELLRQIQAQQLRLEMALDYDLARKKQRFEQLFSHLKQQHPALRLAKQQTSLIKLQQNLQLAMQRKLKAQRNIYQQHQQKFIQAQPLFLIYRHQRHLLNVKHTLEQSFTQRLNQITQRFNMCCSHLDAVSPLATLARGYSVTTFDDGRIVKQCDQVKTGDTIQTRLTDGWIKSIVS